MIPASHVQWCQREKHSFIKKNIKGLFAPLLPEKAVNKLYLWWWKILVAFWMQSLLQLTEKEREHIFEQWDGQGLGVFTKTYFSLDKSEEKLKLSCLKRWLYKLKLTKHSFSGYRGCFQMFPILHYKICHRNKIILRDQQLEYSQVNCYNPAPMLIISG